jgi:hypothetical protein
VGYPENMPKPSPISIKDIKNISPLIQLLEQKENKIKLSHIIRFYFSLKLLNTTEEL